MLFLRDAKPDLILVEEESDNDNPRCPEDRIIVIERSGDMVAAAWFRKKRFASERSSKDVLMEAFFSKR